MTKAVETGPIPLTDMGNAERFARDHGNVAKFVHAWGKWYVFNGRFWQQNDSGQVWRLAKETARNIYREAAGFTSKGEAKAVASWANRSQAKDRLGAALFLAQSEQPIPLSHETLDSDGWLLNCENGTIDLRTGVLGNHRPEDFQSMSTGVEYPSGDAPAPRWEKFLSEIFEGKQSLIGFVQRLCGVAIVGHVYEHILPMAIGTGCNGKSVLWETIRNVLGHYAMTAPQGLLMVKRFQTHSTEVADLFRKRLVIVSETNDGASLNEGLVKSITGGEAIRARRMREDNWQFEPSHTLLLVTNHRPTVKGRDVGIWRRLRLIPFNAQISAEKQDQMLAEKLRTEFPAILRWMVQGCLDWHRDGLQAPSEVLIATDEFKAQQDVHGTFLGESCMVGASYQVKSATLYKAYRQWCDQSGEPAESNQKFKAAMCERGFEIRKNVTNWWVGLTLNEGFE